MTRLTLTLIALAGIAHIARAQEYQLVDLGTFGGESQALAVGPTGAAAGIATGQDSHFDAFLHDSSLTPIPITDVYAEHAAFAITAGGKVYGYSFDMGGLSRSAFMVDAGTLVPLGAFAARAANDAGQVAGSALIASSGLTVERACRYANGSITTLPTLGGESSKGLGIDDTGRVVGSSTTAAENGQRPCLWVGTTAKDMGTIGGAQGQARAIASGWAVGASQTTDGTWHATRWQVDADGHILHVGDLGVLAAGTSSFAMGLNAHGDAVGVSAYRAVRWRDGVVTDLNTLIASDPNWLIEKANAINDSGVIAATARRVDTGYQHAVLLRPTGTYTGGTGGGGGSGDGGGGGANKPDAPVLDTASDLGVSSADGLTSSKDLNFVGNAEARAQVRIYIDGTETNRTAIVNTSGHYRVKVTNAPTGVHAYQIIVKNRANQLSGLSDPTYVTRDSVAPPTPAAPTLDPADRVTTSKPNEIATRNTQPTILGQAVAGNTVQLLSGSRVLGTAIADNAGNYSIQPTTPLRAGSTVSLKVLQTKPSGAVSSKSRELKIKVLQ
ncbi:MAG: hypothetical protein JSR77_14960 [Planctomycetes bacterium]|nr:hypothetical protein [Planctomycetota bacterium]